MSIFAEIPLTPVSPPEQNNGCYFLKCWLPFEDSVEIEELKSHTRPGRYKFSFIVDMQMHFLSSVISLIGNVAVTAVFHSYLTKPTCIVSPLHVLNPLFALTKG